jgi:hypothetical protein
MFHFDPQRYGVAAPLLDPTHVMDLGPGKPNEGARAELQALTPESLFGDRQLVDADMARCCLGGLWLLHDFLHESHAISQEINTVAGSYWHGIMHRREPDFSNAKYWFRRVGQHPVFEPLADMARELANKADLDLPSAFLLKQERWDPGRFVDLCEAATRGQSKARDLCRRIAQEEWRLLFDHCYRHASHP